MKLCAVREATALPEAEKHAPNVEEGTTLSKLSICGEYVVHSYSSSDSQRKILFSRISQGISTRQIDNEDNEGPSSPSLLSSRGSFLFKDDLFKEYSVSHGYFFKKFKNNQVQSQSRDGGDKRNQSHEVLDASQFIYSVSAYGRLRIWTFSGESGVWILSASLLLQDFPRKITNAWLDYFHGDVLSLLWVDAFDLSLSIYQADLFAESTQGIGIGKSRKAYHPKLFESTSGNDVPFRFSLGPSRKLISQSLSDSPIKPPTFTYRDKTLWIISTKQNQYQITIIDLFKSTTSLVSLDRDYPINYRDDIIQFVQFFDASLDESYLRKFHSSSNSLLQYQFIHTNNSLYLLYYHPIVGRWMKNDVIIPDNSLWTDVCSLKVKSPGKHPAATRSRHFPHTQLWSQVKLQIVCHNKDNIYLCLFLPTLLHMCLARVRCPVVSHVPASVIISNCCLEILAQSIPIPSLVDIHHYSISYITYEATASLPDSQIFSTMPENDRNSLTYLLKSMRPWEVKNESLLRLPLYLMSPINIGFYYPAEVIYLEVHAKKMPKQQQGNIDFSKFDCLSEIFEAIFSKFPVMHDISRKQFQITNPITSPTVGSKQTQILQKYDHLSFYRDTQQQENNGSSYNEVTTCNAHRLEHAGQALYELMIMAGVLESKTIAGKVYYRLVEEEETPLSRQEANETSSVNSWTRLCVAAESWIPLNYQVFLYVSHPKVKTFAINHGLSENSHKQLDPWVFENEEEVLSLAQTTRCLMRSASQWRMNWMDHLDIIHLFPSCSAHSSLIVTETHSPMLASSSSMDILATLLSPETFLQLLSSCHSYPAARIMYPALWQEPQHQMYPEQEDVPVHCHPVMTLVQWLLYTCPDHLYLVIDMLLQAHERLLLHDLQILYGDDACVMFEKYQHSRYVLGQEEKWKLFDNDSVHNSDEDDAASVFVSVPSEDFQMETKDTSKFISPSLSHLYSLVSEERGQEEMPVKSLGWGHILNFAFRPLQDASLPPPSSQHVQDSRLCPLSSDASRISHVTSSNGGIIRKTSSENVFDNLRNDEKGYEETDESALAGSSDYGSGSELPNPVHNIDENERSMHQNHDEKEDYGEEESVFFYHKIDHRHLQHMLRHSVLAVLDHHLPIRSTNFSPSVVTEAPLTPVQEDALLRVLLRCGHYLDLARILLKMRSFAQLYRLALRLCLVSNLHDHLVLVREEEFDPEHGAAIVKFRLLAAEKGEIWHNYYHQKDDDSVIKSLFNEDLISSIRSENSKEEEGEEEEEDWETLSVDIDAHQHQEDIIRLREHSEEILSKYGDIVLTIHSWKEKPPSLREIQRKLERTLPTLHQHRRRQAREVFACTLRVLLALLYQQSSKVQRWNMLLRVVKLLQRSPLDLFSESDLGRLIEQSLPAAPLEAQEQRRVMWQKVVEYLTASDK